MLEGRLQMERVKLKLYVVVQTQTYCAHKVNTISPALWEIAMGNWAPQKLKSNLKVFILVSISCNVFGSEFDFEFEALGETSFNLKEI